MRLTELLHTMVEMADEFMAGLRIKSLEIRGDEHQRHRAVGAEEVAVDEGEAHAAGDVGHQALAQSQRVGGDQLGGHSGFVVHDHLVVARHRLVGVRNGGVETGVHRRVHERRHVHHGVVERIERHVGFQTVERVGDALVVGEDGVHKLVHIADHHLGGRTRHLHEEFVFHLHIAEHQTAFRFVRLRQQLHQILLKMRLRRKNSENDTTHHHKCIQQELMLRKKPVNLNKNHIIQI